jgi:signal transduction histidine kinase
MGGREGPRVTRAGTATAGERAPEPRGDAPTAEARERVPRAFKVAALTTGALIGASLALRVLNPFGVPPPDVSDWVPHLWAMGALTVVALTHTWAPTIAWSALIVGATAAAYGVEGIAREYRAVTLQDPSPALAILLTIALSIPPLVAAAYATGGGGRRARSIDAAAWAGAFGLSALLIWALVRRALDAERGGVPGWAWLGIITILWGLGLARDLRPAVVRTRTRLRTEGRPNRPGAAFVALRVFLDELVPGREAGRAEAAESERGRLAADLHAEVLPSLRRALAEAESGGTVERLAADLRTAVDEVEAMLLARRSIVLEEMGLLSGLEWLAERTEDRSDVRVQILVETDASGVATGAGAGTSGRPPRDVERAAFRVAQLALDNVVRHAPGASVAVRVAVAPGRVHVRVEDDAEGPPIDEAGAARRGRRGLADMRAEAQATGASLQIGRGAGDRGTAIDYRWDA